MEFNLSERSSLISSNVLAALASSSPTAKKAVAVRGDLHLKRKAFRARKPFDLANTRGKVDDAVAKVDGALEKALTALLNDAVETALMATLLALPSCTTSSTVANIVDDNFAASWWGNDAKTVIAGLEEEGPLSSPLKAADQDCASPKPRTKTVFTGKPFVSTSTTTCVGSSTPFDAAAAAGPAFSTARSVTPEPTSFAVYLQASNIATLRPTATPTYIKFGAPEIEQVEAAPALEPVAAVTAPRGEADEWTEFRGWSKVFKRVKGVWTYQNMGYCYLNEAKVADEQGKKPARIGASSSFLLALPPPYRPRDHADGYILSSTVVHSADMCRRIKLNVPLCKGFDISLALPGRDGVRFSALQGSETVRYIIKVRPADSLALDLAHLPES